MMHEQFEPLLFPPSVSLHTERTKPVLKWAGGKTGLLDQLIPLFPKSYARYVEPFLGGGAVLFSLPSHTAALVNDANREIVHLYKVIRDEPFLLMSALDELKNCYSEEFYYELRKSVFTDNTIQSAARTVFLNKTGFNGLYRQNSRGEFNVPFGKRAVCPALYDRDNLLAVSRRLKYATLSCQDFENLLNQTGEGDFVYCDPPYEPLSTTSSFNAYKANGFSQDDQRRLYEACLRASERGAFVMISNSSAEFIFRLYEKCEVKSIAARRSINSNAEKRGPVQEVVAIMKPFSLIVPQVRQFPISNS